MQPKPWARLIAEAVAIVVSILLAFAIDAWWGARQLRDEERRALRNLEIEFSANVLAIDAVAEHHRKSIEAGERLLAAAAGEAPVPPRPQLDTLLMSALIDFVTYESSSSALNDLLSSGRLDVIRDDTLRASLAIWPTVVEDIAEDQQLVVRFVETSLLPYLTARIATGDLYNAGHAGFGPFTPASDQADLAALLRERELRSHLANRIAHERTVLRQLEGYLRPIAESIVAHLREERP